MKFNRLIGAALIAFAVSLASCDEQNWTSKRVHKPKANVTSTTAASLDHWVFEQAGGPGGEWRWTHIAPNNRIVGSSTESYKNLSDCVANAKRNGARDEDIPDDIRVRVNPAP